MALEHLYCPDRAISKITKWLKPGGQLLFSIPYFEGFEFRVFKSYAYGLHLPNHLYFFNKSHIRGLLGSSYRKIRFVFHRFDRDIVASSHYRYQSVGSPLLKLVAYSRPVRYLIVKPFVFFLSLFGWSSRVTVFAIKNE